ncbi:hypothetical protein ZIOFF_035962 [Zingiber officinale]|uniref:Uncharacterized protein n=1 Tax=Zingiber officinale TaxID=94328 RepID=A0A8J5GCL1_ZINOF|nr:hypothetical protein ZIOFF_035962 [Zingiber officinale]
MRRRGGDHEIGEGIGKELRSIGKQTGVREEIAVGCRVWVASKAGGYLVLEQEGQDMNNSEEMCRSWLYKAGKQHEKSSITIKKLNVLATIGARNRTILQMLKIFWRMKVS